MKRLVVTVVVSTLVLTLLSLIAPAQAASDDGAVSSVARPTFHALSRMPDGAYRSLTPLTDDELDSVTGAAFPNIAINLGIVVQLNVCAICRDVTQTNIGFLRQSISRLRL
jgi:hypothetical protein